MRYDHDCTNCKPLGEFGDYDLYFCPLGGGVNPTLIARYGSEGGSYKSGIAFVGYDVAITEGYKRAVKEGFLKDTLDTREK